MTDAAFSTDPDCARALDAADGLKSFRRAFHLPKEGRRTLHYLCGHSLGLMPKRARRLVDAELERWAALGVDGHSDNAGWVDFHARFAPPLAKLVGAHSDEVVAMNTLTVNLHLMMVSFFRPQGKRRRIVIERDAFPSDRYAVRSQLAHHGIDEQELVEISPDPESGRLEPAVLERVLEAQGDRVALVLLPGVQYLTGEVLDLAGFSAVARRHGCRVGFDLAHAIGNVPLSLHDSDADFAVWCSYKYLNAGPGAVGGCFVHERAAREQGLARFAGWWGHDAATRFEMPARFAAMPGAQGWQLSNPPILSLAPLAASLALFERAGLSSLRAKSLRLNAYLAYLLRQRLGNRISILTPRAARARGSQLSIRLLRPAAECARVTRRLRQAGVVADFRQPDVLRLAPVPLYNRYRDVYVAARALERALNR